MNNINQPRLALLASCLMDDVNACFDDNEICVAEFKDRCGNPCQLYLVVKPKPKRSLHKVLPVFNCLGVAPGEIGDERLSDGGDTFFKTTPLKTTGA